MNNFPVVVEKKNKNETNEKVKNNIIISVYIIVFYVIFSHPLFVQIFSLVFSHISNNSIVNENNQLNIFGQIIVGCIFAIIILLLTS
tara:strand:+ start:2181 stop:2441 length:261 start_codon:yes stop_codon:yes gene_type:complete